MKKLIYFLGLLFVMTLALPNTGIAQAKQLTKKEQRKLERQKKKEKRLKKSTTSRKFYTNLIKNKRWVFQATRLFGPSGVYYSVTPDLNFVAVQDNKIILQFGFQGVIGWNGVGGITAEGFLTDFKFNPGKNSKQAMSISANIQPKYGGGSPYFTMDIGNDGSANITVTLINGGTLRMGGQIYSPAQSSVYKGQTFP
jgi:hypothetical protein